MESLSTKKTLSVHQLDVREAADLLDELASGWKVHAIDILMDGQSDIPSPLVFKATGTSYESFPLDIDPDALPGLYEEVGRVNPFLAATIQRRIEASVAALQKVSEDLIKQLQTQTEGSPSEKPLLP